MGDMITKLVFKTGYENIPDPPPDFFSITMKDLDEQEINFRDFEDKFKAFLIVNVASR
jgi:hypothetical protein